MKPSFLILLIFITTNALAQDYYNRDSLWQVFSKSKPDTNRVTLYIQLGQQYENNNPDSAIMLYEAALHLSEDLNYIPGIIKYYTNVTYVYNVLGRYDTSLVLNLKSVEIAKAYGNKERLGSCLGNVGSSYLSMKKHDKAVEYFLKALEIFESLHYENKLSVLYSNLGWVYRDLGQYEQALVYGEKSLVLARNMKNDYAITAALVNLATIYTSLNQLDKSNRLFEEASVIARRTKNDYSLLSISLNLGNIHLKLRDFSALKKYYDEALEIARRLDDKESITIALRGLAIYYFNQDNAKEGEQYAMLALAQAVSNNLLDEMAACYSILGEISILKKDFKMNYTYTGKSDSIRSILLNKSIASNIQELEAKYQSEKKQHQIKQLEEEAIIKDLSIKKNELIIYILTGALIFVLLLAYLIRHNYQQKKKLHEKEALISQSLIVQLENEKKLAAGEAVLKGQDEERSRIAKDLHDGLGGLLSGVKFSLSNMKSNVILDFDSAMVFERSLNMLDHSIKELRRVAHNMMPEVLVKFGLAEALKSYCDAIGQSGVFKIDCQSIGLENKLPFNAEIFIYRIVQELLNNAIKHSSATQVLVQLARQDDELSITVEDNGLGFDKSILEKATGAGWANIRSRVEYLKGKVDVQTAPGQGTSTHIIIPIV
jgi:two-component system, NarL family, sensor kinase